MPRFLRSSNTNYYHVVLRVTRREVLASNAQDRRALNEIAIDTMRRYGIVLHAYCLLPHQLRALIQVDTRHLPKALRRIAIRFARYRHPKERIPQLFERPYAAQQIETEADFLVLLRSMHLSPVIANLVVTPDDYPWSSHHAYLGFRSNALIATERGLSLLAAEPTQARTAYHRFIIEGLAFEASNTRSNETVEAPPVELSGKRLDPNLMLSIY